MASVRSALLCASACAALALGACSGAGTTPSGVSPAPPTTNLSRHGWISPGAKKQKLLYVSDYTASLILIYFQGQTGLGPQGEILSGISNPQGIAVDSTGTLYVANEGNSTVTEYPAGSTNPSVTLSTGISSPLDVAVDSDFTVYVSDLSASQVLEFKQGSTSPDVTITSLHHPSQLTNARNNELYVTYNLSGGKVARCKTLSTKCTDLGISVGLAQGVALDQMGNLLVGDVFGPDINIYAKGQNQPFRTISTPLEQPTSIALTTKDADFYMADPANFAVETYDYATGTQTGTFTFGSGNELEGVALFPGQRPG